MAQFEEQLNSILGNREAMGQIMALARSLSGDGAEEPEENRAEPVLPTQGPDLSALLGDLDPGMLQMGMGLIREMGAGEDRHMALLQALQPFLREERRAKLDRALQAAKLIRMARVALETMGGKGMQGDV